MNIYFLIIIIIVGIMAITEFLFYFFNNKIGKKNKIKYNSKKGFFRRKLKK